MKILKHNANNCQKSYKILFALYFKKLLNVSIQVEKIMYKFPEKIEKEGPM